MTRLLVVAGEPSGDRIAASIARALAPFGARAYGMGGSACRDAGVELEAELERGAAMGVTDVVLRLPAIVSAFRRITARVLRDSPHAAVLVDFTEFNLRLARWLKGRAVPVLWCVAPQVWAWRPGRTANIARHLDRMAVILPFEERLWRDAGVDAHYVGHPALDGVLPPLRGPSTARRTALALLPGSRPHEVRRHAPLMVATIRELRRRGQAVDATVFLAPSLEAASRCWLECEVASIGARTVDVSPGGSAVSLLTPYDAALVASGTATLESALAGTPPVIVYRASALTAAVARRLLRTPSVGLPNILLGSRVYPELLQEQAEPERAALAILAVLNDRAAFDDHAEALRRLLALPLRHERNERVRGSTSGQRAASLVHDWLGLAAPLGPPKQAASRERSA